MLNIHGLRRMAPVFLLAGFAACGFLSGCQKQVRPEEAKPEEQVFRAIIDQEQLEAMRQSEQYAAQLEMAAAQIDQAQRQLDRTDRQLDHMDSILKRNEEYARRLEALVERWEKQADRYDRLLQKWENEGRGPAR